MFASPWLPKLYEIPMGGKIQILLYAGSNWQIYQTDNSLILILQSELAAQWVSENLLNESLFIDLSFGEKRFKYLIFNKKRVLAPIENCPYPQNKNDALAFAHALRESRKFLKKEVSLCDAIYVEQYSRFLPTWSRMDFVDDQTVLGILITGGVSVSAESFQDLLGFSGLSADDLAEVVQTAGFKVQNSIVTSFKDVSKESKPIEERVFTLAGRSKLEAFFKEYVIDILLNPDRYKTMGIDFPSPIVLHGPSGCGKTFAVEKLIEFLDLPYFSIDSNSVGSPYIHETSKKISQIFEKAIESAPSVIVIDEMESFLTDRQFAGLSGMHHVEEVAEFLRRIPEATKKQVLVIGMTNLIDMIDPAILRRGRFDHVIEVEMPSKNEITSLIHSLLKNLPKSENLDLSEAVDFLTGRPLSDVTFVVREAARLTAQAGKSQLDQECLNKALNTLSHSQKQEKRSIGFI